MSTWVLFWKLQKCYDFLLKYMFCDVCYYHYITIVVKSHCLQPSSSIQNYKIWIVKLEVLLILSSYETNKYTFILISKFMI